MAEIVGLIASIISIIEGINKSNGFVRMHVHSTSSIRKEIVPILTKLAAFAGLLQALKLQAEFDERDQNRFQILTHIDGPLHACRHAAKAVENRLDRIISIGSLSFGKVLDKNCLSALQIFDQTKPVLELALEADQRTLAKSIESYTLLIKDQIQDLRKDTNESLQRLQERSALIEAHISQIQSSKEDDVDLKRQERILLWTSSLKYRTNYRQARKFTTGVPGTGRWFIDGPDFRQWTSDSPKNRAILLQGTPGAGKTVLCSTIINEIMQTTSIADEGHVAYHFFDFNDPAKQTIEGMLRSLVFQVAVLSETIPKPLEALYSRHHKDRGLATEPIVGEWFSTLLALMEGKDAFYIVIDALDECHDEGQLAETIDSLASRSPVSTRWLVTSQISDKASSFRHYSGFQTLQIESSAVDHDIATFLNAILENDPKLRHFVSSAKKLIRSTIQAKARGMFRWAQCQIEALRQLKDRRLKTVKLVLSQMPEDLASSYERTILQLCSFNPNTAITNEKLVYRILLFVAFSGRPVTVAETAELAIIEDSGESIDPDDRFEDSMSILPFVGNLVNVQDSVLTLAHKSVKDFLESPRALYGPLQLGLFLGIKSRPQSIAIAVDTYIAQKCLGYLALPHLSARETMVSGDVKDPNTAYIAILQGKNPLLDYAASMWSYHVREPTSQQETRNEMERALGLYSKQRQPSLWQGWLFLQRVDIWERQVRLANFLCECFLRSSLAKGWATNFWQSRTNYRFVNNSIAESNPLPDKTDSTYDAVAERVLAPTSKQFHDLSLLLLEIALQCSLFPLHQEKIKDIRTAQDMEQYVNALKTQSEETVPRMGEGYHLALSECLNLIVRKYADRGDPDFLFRTQGQLMNEILQPLRSSASEGFRRSRGIWAFQTSDINSLFAKIKEKKIAESSSMRFSTPAHVPQLNTSSSPSFSRTHGPNGNLIKKSFNGENKLNTVKCSLCNKSFKSSKDLASHKVKYDGFCEPCQICLPSASRGQHERFTHQESHRDARWTMAG